MGMTREERGQRLSRLKKLRADKRTAHLVELYGKAFSALDGIQENLIPMSRQANRRAGTPFQVKVMESVLPRLEEIAAALSGEREVRDDMSPVRDLRGVRRMGRVLRVWCRLIHRFPPPEFSVMVFDYVWRF